MDSLSNKGRNKKEKRINEEATASFGSFSEYKFDLFDILSTSMEVFV